MSLGRVSGNEHTQREEQKMSQFGGVSLLFQGEERDANKRASRELKGNQEQL